MHIKKGKIKMRNKEFEIVYLLFFIVLFLTIVQISGCDSTKGSNVPTAPSGSVPLSITRTPTLVAADGSAFSTITAAVIGGASGTVDFKTTLGTLSAASVNVDSNGKAIVTLLSPIAGIATVTATAGTNSKSTTVTFGLGGIAITGTGNVADTDPDATESSQITFTITDVSGSPVSGIGVTLTTTTSNALVTASFSPSSPSTGTTGVATSFLTTNSQDLGIDVTITMTATATGVAASSAQVVFNK